MVDGTDPELPHTNDTPFRPARDASALLDQHLADSIAALSPAPKAEVKPVSITGLGGTGSTIKTLLEDHKRQMTDLVEGHIAGLKDTLTKQRGAVAAFGRMVESAQHETDDFLAELGQFTNDLGV